MRAIFLSDIHLRGTQDSRLKLLIQRLDEEIAVGSLTQLFLLGDIFDLWVGAHQHFVAEYAELLARLAKLRKMGVEIHYFEGNHDLHLAGYWREQLGAKVHVESVVMNLAGLRVQLEHGDQMNPDDRGYLRLRAFLRTPFMAWAAYALPGAVTEAIGNSMSRASRKWTASPVMFRDETQIRTMMVEHVRRAWADEDFDVLIAGHVHVRLDEQIPMEPSAKNVRVINLGCWPGADRRSRIQDVQVLELTSGDGSSASAQAGQGEAAARWRWINWSADVPAVN
jgi:UDP-2,3-diacylglucosamine hydrolase